jgi:hypothetical protein
MNMARISKKEYERMEADWQAHYGQHPERLEEDIKAFERKVAVIKVQRCLARQGRVGPGYVDGGKRR